MDIAALQERLRAFAAERGWAPFHTPKNLATALLVEAAELVEIFQWKTPEQSLDVSGDAIDREKVGDEAADVILYLAQLADATGIDLEASVERKLAKNAVKHPPTAPGAPASARRGPERKVHVLVDWENVQPKEDDVRALVDGATDLWLFHGPTQRNVGEHHAGFGVRATPVRISRTGKNALDFHLAFYMGYIAARHPDARFVVLSNDNGYKPMLEHAAELGFDTVSVGFRRGRAAPAKAATVTRTRTRTSTAKRAAKAAPVPEAEAPVKKASKRAAKATPTAKKAARKRAAPGEPGEGTAARATAKTAPKAAAKAPARTAGTPTAKRTPGRSRKTASLVGEAPMPGLDADRVQAAFEAAIQSEDDARQRPAARGRPLDPSALAGRIGEQLRAMTEDQRPVRRISLLRMIGSRLPAGTDEAARLAVLERLVAIGAVAVDPRGTVHYPGGVT